MYQDQTWFKTWDWCVQVPQGLYNLLHWINKTYSPPEIIITEVGAAQSAAQETSDDLGQIRFLKEHLSATKKAIHDGIKVTGYYVWSLMDNFEWTDGYTSKFGLMSIDFSDMNRNRKPRKSFECYRNIIRNRAVVDDNCPDGYV